MSQTMQYEIALVNRDGTASLVEGPFNSLAEADDACQHLNEHTQNKPWVVNIWTYTPRAVTCTVRKP